LETKAPPPLPWPNLAAHNLATVDCGTGFNWVNLIYLGFYFFGCSRFWFLLPILPPLPPIAKSGYLQIATKFSALQ